MLLEARHNGCPDITLSRGEGLATAAQPPRRKSNAAARPREHLAFRSGRRLYIANWRDTDDQITTILKKSDLGNAELHTAWLLRSYLEQDKITDFESLSRAARRAAVNQARRAELFRLQKNSKPKPYRQAKKNFKHTEPYIHLTRSERFQPSRMLLTR